MELLDTEAIQIVTNQGRERMQRKGGISQEKKGSLGVDPVPHQGMHIRISLS